MNFWDDWLLSPEARAQRRYEQGWDRIWGPKCCVCNEPCESEPIEYLDRWHWGPDGMNVHYRCEAEFRKRFSFRSV